MHNTFPTLGSAVLYLNDFHFGKRLHQLNKVARIIPDDLMEVAEYLHGNPNVTSHLVATCIEALAQAASAFEE